MPSSASDENAVGVIPARFQVARLHSEHHYVINYVRSRHADRLIVLGSTGGLPTPDDPLPHEVRAGMIREDYPDLVIDTLVDHPLDHVRWSVQLDRLIEQHFPGRHAILYGGRDSFIPFYTGRFETAEIPTKHNGVSGTVERKSVEFPNTVEGRKALIWYANHREPIVYRTVDLAIVDRANDRALFIGKNVHDGLVSFMGGFDNVKGQTDIEALMRELDEELPGIRIGEPQLLGTFPVSDPRYRRGSDGIKTTLFQADYHGGDFAAGDDANYYRWLSRSEISAALVPWHRELGEYLLACWDR